MSKFVLVPGLRTGEHPQTPAGQAIAEVKLGPAPLG